MIEFALNPASQEAAEQIVRTIRAKQHLDWFALLDTAFDHEKPGFPLPQEAVNCFEGNVFLDDMKHVAPVLIPVPHALAPERIPLLIEHRGNRPMLSFIGAEKGVSAGEIAKQWKSLHFIYPEDGERYMLRFADTRTLPNLPRFLSVLQWQAFHQNIAEWHIIGRQGKPEEILLEKTDKRPPFKLSLTEKQFAKMVELDEPDVALSSINRAELDIIPENMTGFCLYDLICRSLEKTAEHGITHWSDKVSLIILAIEMNGEILEDADVDVWLKAREWEEGKISAAVSRASWLAKWN